MLVVRQNPICQASDNVGARVQLRLRLSESSLLLPRDSLTSSCVSSQIAVRHSEAHRRSRISLGPIAYMPLTRPGFSHTSDTNEIEKYQSKFNRAIESTNYIRSNRWKIGPIRVA